MRKNVSFEIYNDDATVTVVDPPVPPITVVEAGGSGGTGGIVFEIGISQSAVAAELGLQWKTRAPASKSRRIFWNVQAQSRFPVAKTLGLAWRVKKTVGDTWSGEWKLRKAQGDTVQPLWKARKAQGDTISPRWNDRAKLGDSVGLVWKQLINSGTYSDNFNDNSYDTTRWTTLAGAPSETGGQLRIPEGTDVVSTYVRDLSLAWPIAQLVTLNADADARYIFRAESLDGKYSAAIIVDNTGGVLASQVFDSDAVIDYNEFAPDLAYAGEYFRIRFSAGNVQFQRSDDAVTWITWSSIAYANPNRLTSLRIKFRSLNNNVPSSGRYVAWDNVSFLSPTDVEPPPPPPPPPPSGGKDVEMWDGLNPMYQDALNGWPRHTLVNSLGATAWVNGSGYVAGHGGVGDWTTAGGGSGGTPYPSAYNQQQLMGGANDLKNSLANRKVLGGIYFRPGDGNTPKPGTAGWSPYCNHIKNMCQWMKDTNHDGLTWDMEFDSSPLGDWRLFHSVEATARQIVFDAGAELMTKMCEGWPGLHLRIYGHAVIRTWRHWQYVSYEQFADWNYFSCVEDFYAGMCSVNLFATITWLLEEFYKDTQGRYADGTAGVSFTQAADYTYYGMNPTGTILTSWGVPVAGLLGWLWYFINRFNTGGAHTAGKLKLRPFIWIGNVSPTELPFSNVKSPAYVTGQVNGLLAATWVPDGVEIFDYDGLSMAQSNAPFGGYSQYPEVFAISEP